MKISEIAPPGREKQVKKLKKKFDDPGAPYAIAWAQHNKHGKPKKNEGKMSDIDADMKTLSDQEFQKKYGKSKEQMKKDLNEAFNSERDEVKAILDKYGIKNSDDVEYGSEVYQELYNYFANSGEMPYGVMKARDGDPDQWIADRIDDLGLLEQDDPTSTKLSSNDIEKKAIIYMMRQHKNPYGDSSPQELKNIEAMIRHIVDGESLDPELQDELNQRLRDAKIKDRTGRFAMRKMDVDRYYKDEWKTYSPTESVDVDEAPFGQAVKGALGRVASRTATAVKKKVGAVPGLGSLKTTAQAQQSLNDVSDQVWDSYLKFKATNPDEAQKIAWFKKNHQMDVKATIDQNGDITRDEVEASVKTALAQQQSGKVGTPKTDTQDKKDVQVKLDLLKKSDPTANVTTLVALKKFAKDGKLDPTRQQALQPLVAKIANALNNPGKANILARALQESLSQSDLSKLDMLAREGLVNKNKVSRFKTAMRMLAKDKDLPISYKDDVIEVVSKLAKIITKPSVMGMVRKGLKENQTTTTAQEQFKTWVNQADDIIS